MFILKSLVLNSVFIYFHSIFNILVFVSVDIESFLVCLHVVDNINVCSVNIFQSSLLGVDSDTLSLVYSDNFDSVTRLDVIHKIFIGA
jgi:hypothetical protein